MNYEEIFKDFSKSELMIVSSLLRKLKNKVDDFKEEFEEEVENILVILDVLTIRKSEVIK